MQNHTMDLLGLINSLGTATRIHGRSNTMSITATVVFGGATGFRGLYVGNCEEYSGT